MTPLAEAEHFAHAPQWTWYILFYFFLAGLSGGSYVIATLLRLRGGPADEAAARVGYYVALPTLAGCPVLLTLDLGQPLRFWHMLVNTTPGDRGAVFKSWSPMSVGSWVLLVFGVFVAVSFLGLAFTFITRPFYPYYVETPRLWGLSPSEDQNLGGVIMNAEQAIVFLSALVFAIAALLDRQDRETAGYRD